MEFSSLDLTFHKMEDGREDDVTSFWPGSTEEDVLVCVFKGTRIQEPFHRQDFFFLNYAYRGSYQALSARFNNTITIRQDECYLGQPYSGHALRCDNTEETVIVGVLIRKDAFFRDYLSLVYADAGLFRFFLEPRTNRFSDEYLHLSATSEHPIRTLLELMILEYADRREDSQPVLKALLQALILHIVRRYRLAQPENPTRSLSWEIARYIADHSDTVTLTELSARFSYHPNYISALLPRETGKTFSRLLLEARMERAVLLLRNTTLSIEEIAGMTGYSDQSNFYKAFREMFGTSPREYLKGVYNGRTPDSQ